MTIDEAISVLKVHREFFGEEIEEALNIAIESLEKKEANDYLVTEIRNIIEEYKTEGEDDLK